jgi:hypothetical protein
MIKVPPAPAGDVVIERGRSATFRTDEGGVASMDEADVNVVSPGVERNARDSPRVLQGQELREEGALTHGLAARDRGLETERLGLPEANPKKHAQV